MAFSTSVKIYPISKACELCSQSGFYKDLSTLPLSHPWPWLLHQFHVAKTSRGGLHFGLGYAKEFQIFPAICQLNWLLMIGLKSPWLGAF